MPLHDTVGRKLFWHRAYEVELVDFIRRQQLGGGVCVDVGANIGYIACVLSRAVGPSGKVIAVEPDPETAALAELNLRMNGFAHPVLRKAAADEDGQTEFVQSVDSGYSGIRHTGRRPIGKHIFVETARLDNMYKEAAPVSLLKIDIEGAELPALRGASALLRGGRRPRVVIVESNTQNQATYGYTERDLVAFMASCGFREMERHGGSISANIVFG